MIYRRAELWATLVFISGIATAIAIRATSSMGSLPMAVAIIMTISSVIVILFGGTLFGLAVIDLWRQREARKGGFLHWTPLRVYLNGDAMRALNTATGPGMTRQSVVNRALAHYGHALASTDMARIGSGHAGDLYVPLPSPAAAYYYNGRNHVQVSAFLHTWLGDSCTVTTPEADAPLTFTFDGQEHTIEPLSWVKILLHGGHIIDITNVDIDDFHRVYGESAPARRQFLN